jgi:nucleotide-binding universal stress UspA family protein
LNKDVLVPIDGSRIALRALDYALAGVKRDGATVHLLNVQPALDDYGMVGAHFSTRKHRELCTQRGAAMLAPAIAAAKRARVAHEAHVVVGEVADSIARAVKRTKSACIVMGTRGMGAAGNMLLGSNATKVVHLVKVPVTLIK